MKNRRVNWSQSQNFVDRQIQPDVGKNPAAWRNRPAKRNPGLTRPGSPRIRIDVEYTPIRWKFNTGPIEDPICDPFKGVSKKPRVDMSWVPQGKVKVFGETVGFKETLSQARAALENPVIGKGFVLIDTRQNPAQHIVLFDYLRQERFRPRNPDDFTAINHGCPP